MAHKKKGSKKGNTAANGASKPQPAAADVNGEPHSYKEAVTSNLDINGSEEVNGNNTPEDASPQTSPRTDGSADKDLPKPEGKPAEAAKPKSAQPQPGEHAAQDARKALEDTVENLRGDLRAEKVRREKAEESVLIWKGTSAVLGLSTLGCAAFALVALVSCRRN
ncbi:hypothetical protein WJX75_003801 [Coccomyxa subellipsoidea]|uniref:Transmembrane protein n=1 Tax=Coccomyxa subellipsoidea TaxID=248742 RepID=A0ABR2YJD1_9CHLO